MADIPILSPPQKDFCGWHWHHQFTIPLLFDDCLSLLQKVCALWNKLNDVISALNDFNDKFNEWATNVENQIKDLYAKYVALEQRVTKNENDIKNLTQQLTELKNQLGDLSETLNNFDRRISNLEQFKQDVTNSINQITNDILDLEKRVKALEDLLENLNIIPPQTILDLNDDDVAWSKLWNNWWSWFCLFCIDFASGDNKVNWEMSSNLEWWDTVTKPQRTIQVGYLGQPVCLVKLPFIAVRKNVWTSEPTIDQIKAVAPTFKKEALTPSNGFFNVDLTKEFGFQIDEVKLMTSYVPFLADKSHIIKMPSAETAFGIQTDVRLQVPKTGSKAKLCVIPQRLCVAAVPNAVASVSATAWDLYIYAIAENG